tara:strand:- start:254 stop:520 length:267 start_codon:yes stop_codon:yes gene_type:complete
MQETPRFEADAQPLLSNREIEDVQAFSDKLFQLLAEQAEKNSHNGAVAVAFLERALDFAHFAYGKDGAKNLTLDMLQDIQKRYDFERN